MGTKEKDHRKDTSFQTCRKPLVVGSGLYQTFVLMIFCHFTVTLLCVNVLLDLVFFGIPIFSLWKLKIIPSKTFYSLTSKLINWTTPIVFGLPMVLSRSKIYCKNPIHLIEAKSGDSLLLANHGSRIDWMVGMVIGYTKSIGNKICCRGRVGFVCEAPIQFMPIVGWYRKVICDDIFVWRSFEKDAPTIKSNINQFQQSETKRMLVLSPEGVIVDYSDKDKDYIQNCRKFCTKLGYKPFEYILTPRYKGTTCLLDQVKNSDVIVSVCLVYVRNKKLLNCRLTSSERVIPDLYLLAQGIGSQPVDVFVHTRRIQKSSIKEDTRTILMMDNAWKDSVLEKWESFLEKKPGYLSMTSKFEEIKYNKRELLINHFAHFFLMITISYFIGWNNNLFRSFFILFCIITTVHTLGWVANSSSMESVPFETGVKAVASYFLENQQKQSIA